MSYRDPQWCERPGPPPMPPDVAKLRFKAEEMAQAYNDDFACTDCTWEWALDWVIRPPTRTEEEIPPEPSLWRWCVLLGVIVLLVGGVMIGVAYSN